MSPATIVKLSSWPAVGVVVAGITAKRTRVPIPLTLKAPLEPLWQMCPHCEAPVAPQEAIPEDTWDRPSRTRKSHW